jgi:L-aspartate oxidase
MDKFSAIVLGSGLAGLSVALRLAEAGEKVALISKRELSECNSFYAQGGIAAVINQNDSFESHIRDTLVAGAGLCNSEAVKFIVENAPAAIEWLMNAGVNFTREKNDIHLTREGGHSARRVLHVADATGAAIVRALVARVLEHDSITVFEHFIAVDLITEELSASDIRECAGLYAFDIKTNQVKTFSAPNIVLATGGAGKAYLYTTNPDVATGDGIAMAFRAGCAVANMEFIQFHPTCLYHEKAKSFLISEAVRGEGGILTLPDGTRFMAEHDARMELAPRDIVARAIDFEMKKYGADHVCLDISHKPKDFILEHFPNIYAKCLSLGLDISREPIPVVPAAHYTCGGVITDLSGKTSIRGLYAVGECACTGLHGANRLASNSLLECLVVGEALVKNILADKRESSATLMPWDESQVSDADEEIVISHNWDELRRLMWDYVGIVRSNKRLERALRRVSLLRDEINEYYANFKISADLIELRNLVLVAELIIKSAKMRKESRGLHFSLDYPDCGSEIYDTLLR